MIQHPTLPILLFLAQCTSTLFMAGLIWFVQIVHYPLFAEVGTGAPLRRYETLHATRTGWVVFPPMLVELLSSLAALYPPLRPAFLPWPIATVLATLVLALWITTGLVQVPLHDALGKPADRPTETRKLHLLVATNWIRTVVWTLRAALLLYTLALVLFVIP